ncbi:MAG TPA: histidine triad nucleotide-binding protein [Desulfobacteria bacterium]|nr:histidine triad nucleotide-binding protein [Desulfobacteria bacterium]
MDNCLFCSIVARNIPAKIVYEDERVLAFQDINPVAPVHVLIIPKIHRDSLVDASEGDKELLGHILLTANKIAAQLGIAEKGFRLINNCGEEGGQVIKHLHFHLIGGKKLGAKIV